MLLRAGSRAAATSAGARTTTAARATATPTPPPARAATPAAPAPPPARPAAPRAPTAGGGGGGGARAPKAVAGAGTAKPPARRGKPPVQRDFAGRTGAADPQGTLRVFKDSDVGGAAGALAKSLRAQLQQGAAEARRASAAAAPPPAAGAAGGIVAPAPASARPPVVRLWAPDRPAAARALSVVVLADRMLRQTDGRMIVFQPTVVTRGGDEDEDGEGGNGGGGGGGGGGGNGNGGGPRRVVVAPAAVRGAAGAALGPQAGEYIFFVGTLPAGEIVADNILSASGGGREQQAAATAAAAPAPEGADAEGATAAAAAAADGAAAAADGVPVAVAGDDGDAAAASPATAPGDEDAPAASAAPPAAAAAPAAGRPPRRPDGLAGDGGALAQEAARALSRAVMARVLGRGHTAVEARGARAAAVALDAAIGARRGLLVRARDAAVLIGSNSGAKGERPPAAAAAAAAAAALGGGKGDKKGGGGGGGAGRGAAPREPMLLRLVVVECAPRDVTAVRLRAAGDQGAEPSAAVRRSA